VTESRKNLIKSKRLGQFVLGLLVFSWLGAAAQPCLTGIDAATQSPAMSEHSGHSGHSGPATEHATDAGGPPCGHCPPGAGHHNAGPCSGSLKADCVSLPEVGIDARGKALKVDKDAPQACGVAPLATENIYASSRSPCIYLDADQRRFAIGPSLSVRYCVYLK
jgi:hypothetical protein